MFGFGNEGRSFWPFEYPDNIDLLYINEAVKKVRGREIRKMVYSLLLITMMIVLMLLMQSISGFVYGGFWLFTFIAAAVIVGVYGFRIYYFRGVPEEYGIIKGSVLESRVRLSYGGKGRPRTKESVDVLCNEGIICSNVEVLTAGSEFRSYTNYVQKFYSGDSVNIVRLNSNTIFAVK